MSPPSWLDGRVRCARFKVVGAALEAILGEILVDVAVG